VSVFIVGLGLGSLTSFKATAAERSFVIQGATVLTMTHGTIEGGSVLVENGKIAAVGKDLPIPSGAEVIDARGEYLLPGLIDPHSHLGVYSLPGLQANSDGN
jgi:imidazolonepropionase-like amidohydrolase